MLSLTATPFRADEQPIEGEPIYRYPFRDAMRRGYIKQITARNVAPREFHSPGTATSTAHPRRADRRSATRTGLTRVAYRGEQRLDRGRVHPVAQRPSLGRMHHQLIAVACSMDHARQVRGLYEERGPEAREIHTAQREDEQEAILARPSQRRARTPSFRSRCLAKASTIRRFLVAAIFRPFRSLTPTSSSLDERCE